MLNFWQTVQLYDNLFEHNGRFYVGFYTWNAIPYQWAQFGLAGKQTLIENCIFRFYSMYGIMETNPTLLRGNDEASTYLNNNTFEYNTSGVIWNLSIFAEHVRISNGDILVQGMVIVQDKASITLTNNIKLF